MTLAIEFVTQVISLVARKLGYLKVNLVLDMHLRNVMRMSNVSKVS